MNLQNLSCLRKYVTLAEHKAGTIKLKIAFAAASDPKVKELMAEFRGKSLPKAILDTKVNIFTQTLSITYDTSEIAPKDFEEILTTKDDDRFLALAEHYHNKFLC